MSAQLRLGRYDVDNPRWDQSTFFGRLCYFITITDPLKAFASQDTLQDSKRLLELYRTGKEPHGTTVEDLQRAQAFYGSAFHPDTGQLQTLLGRMCANAWGGTLLCGAMMLWYRSTRAVVFWQWANQSFNALVNYTNRNAQSPLDLLVAYTSAVTGALGVAVSLKNYLSKRAFSPLSQRFVPLAAVAVANAINIPFTRQNELLDGLPVTNETGHVIARSKLAACKAISLVVFSRNVIVTPSMLLIPLIMNAVEKCSWYTNRAKFLNIPVQIILTFILYGSMIPVGCALFPQINNNIDALRASSLRGTETSYGHKYAYNTTQSPLCLLVTLLYSVQYKIVRIRNHKTRVRRHMTVGVTTKRGIETRCSSTNHCNRFLVATSLFAMFLMSSSSLNSNGEEILWTAIQFIYRVFFLHQRSFINAYSFTCRCLISSKLTPSCGESNYVARSLLDCPLRLRSVCFGPF
ncbi:Sideroflexin [Dirofilaria immitis]|nr:Sideroflexin [Dirofilaria immitis]